MARPGDDRILRRSGLWIAVAVALAVLAGALYYVTSITSERSLKLSGPSDGGLTAEPNETDSGATDAP
jgi:hypothetical protein